MTNQDLQDVYGDQSGDYAFALASESHAQPELLLGSVVAGRSAGGTDGYAPLSVNAVTPHPIVTAITSLLSTASSATSSPSVIPVHDPIERMVGDATTAGVVAPTTSAADAATSTFTATPVTTTVQATAGMPAVAVLAIVVALYWLWRH